MKKTRIMKKPATIKVPLADIQNDEDTIRPHLENKLEKETGYEVVVHEVDIIDLQEETLKVVYEEVKTN